MLVAVSVWLGSLIAFVSVIAIVEGQMTAIVGLVVGLAIFGWGMARHDRYPW